MREATKKYPVPDLKIGIIGAGALGALYGARIARAGYDVHFLMRSDFDAVRREGLQVKSFQGDFVIRPPVYRTPAEMGVCDLLVIGLKSTDNGALEELLGPAANASTVVVTLQNGLGNEEQIAEVLARLHPKAPAAERILGGVAFLCSNRVAPGVIHHLEYGRVRLAEFGRPLGERTESIAQLFRDAEFECEACESLLRIRWEKLVWNVPFNGLGVGADGADTRTVIEDGVLRRVARGLMREVLDGAAAEGVEIAPSFMDKMFELTESMGPYRSSMQVDFEMGRRLEVEVILGEALRRSRKAGVETPRLEMLYGIVRRADQLREKAQTKDSTKEPKV